MLDELPEISCPACNRSFPSRQLRMKSVTIESCPYCQCVVRETKGFSYNDEDAIVLGDVSAIGAWLDQVSKAHNVSVEHQTTANSKDNLWCIETALPWNCIIAYHPLRSNTFVFRLDASHRADQISINENDLQTICARHGVQPSLAFSTDHLTGDATCKWGSEQCLSVYALSIELFPVVLERLDVTMNDVAHHFGL